MASHRALLPADAPSLRDLVPQLPVAITIEGEEAEHLVVVRRAEVGEPVELIDGHGGIAHGRVTAMQRSKKAPTITIELTTISTLPEPTCQITIWSAIPKGDRSATMIDMLAQVGAHAWAPLHTSRGVVEASDHKASRLHRVATEASKQSGRPWHLQILPAASLQSITAWRKSYPSGLVFIADAQGITKLPAAPINTPIHALLLVGPEGGFTDQELQTARASGAMMLTLGEHILRIETAAIAGAVTLLHAWRE